MKVRIRIRIHLSFRICVACIVRIPNGYANAYEALLLVPAERNDKVIRKFRIYAKVHLSKKIDFLKKK